MNMRERALKIKEKAMKAFVTAEAAVVTTTAAVSAKAFGQNVTLNTRNLENADPAQTMGSAVGVVLTIFQFLGIGAVAFGAAQLALSIIEDQPEKRLKGFAFLGGGVILIGLRYVLKGMGFIA